MDFAQSGATLQLSTYEPAPLEITLTCALGLTVLSPYYRSFAQTLNLRGNERVLDFGSGSGICSRHIAARLKHGGHLDCVDISRGWQTVIRKTLRRYNNVGFYLGRISEIDLPDDFYDSIVIHFVLHDIPVVECSQIVEALAQLLKPGGRLIVREPGGHGLTKEELTQLIKTAGLQTESIQSQKVFIGQVYDGCFTH